MKASIIFRISVLVLLTACNSQTESDIIKEFIPGTYIRFSQHEYGSENDTVVITLQNKSANEFKVVRKWKYERILDGKAIEPEYKNLTTSAIYNENTKMLRDAETGENYSFDTKQNAVFSGTTKYLKLK